MRSMTALAIWERIRMRRVVDAIGPFFGLLLVIGLFSVDPEVRQHYLSGGNLKIILTQTVIVAISAFGMTMIIVSGGIDLSVGSVIALTSVVGAKLFASGVPPVLAVTGTLLTGALVGLVNGSLISGFRIMPFIVTLGMMSVARGIAKGVAENQVINVPQDSIVSGLMAKGDVTQFFPLPLGVWVMLGLAVLMSLVMIKTVFGRYLFAIGSNEATARLCGIHVQGYKIVIYSIAGLFFGLSGLMQLARLNQGDPTVAMGLELDVIAAVVIGGASLGGGTGSILGSIIGALIMAALRNGTSQVGFPNYVQEIIIGGVIILAVGLDKLRNPKKEGGGDV